MDITFYELHDDISEPLTICTDCAPQAVTEGFRVGAKIVGSARCDSCGKGNKRIRIALVCQECGKVWRVGPNSDPQCPSCNSVDYEVRA